MAKLKIFDMLTVNGYYADKDGGIDWHQVDEEFNDFAIKQLGEVGLLMFGKTTYEMMASYWPTEGAINDDPEVAKLMNETPKVVISTTLKSADWQITRLISDDVENQIRQLKEAKTKDIFIFGSGILTQSLLNAGLIDEIRLITAPIILKEGKALFANLKQPLNLKTIDTRTFKNGNVLVRYDIIRNS